MGITSSILLENIMKILFFLILISVLTSTFNSYAASYDDLKPLLIDLKDWNCEEAQGTSMDTDGVKIIMVTRNCQTMDDKNIDFQFGLMPGATAGMAQMNINMESDEAIVSTSTIDGFLVYQNFDKNQKSGEVIVILKNNDETSSQMFILNYSGINNKDALVISKQFDWKKMHATLEDLK